MPQHSFKEALGLREPRGECRYPVEYARYPNQYTTVDKRQAIAHIKYLIRNLRRYDNCEIALFADKADVHRYAKDLLRTPWLVKGEAAVLTATYTESENGQGHVVAADLEITEPSVVRAFRQQFLEIWNAIADPDKAKHKENVIGWLTRLLEEAKGTGEGSRG